MTLRAIPNTVEILWFFCGLILFTPLVQADEDLESLTEPSLKRVQKCQNALATAFLKKGMKLQEDLKTDDALANYQDCLKLEESCVACRYEIGWSYWKQGKWDEVIKTWKRALELEPTHPEVLQYLPTAQQNKESFEDFVHGAHFRVKTPIGTYSTPSDAKLYLRLVRRIQSYARETASPMDLYDPEIHSPKSVRFMPDSRHIYINSLEAGKTLYYDTETGQKLGRVDHTFGPEEANLFDQKRIYDYRLPRLKKPPNQFKGKPVEEELTHGGRYLFTPYYRRSYDLLGQHPSAMAVIDTKTHEIARVYGVGPISKYVRASHNGKLLAVSHWGDNTVGLWDISAADPKKFKRTHLLIVEERLKTKGIKGDRDKKCGFCVRGLAFSPDDRYLFVTRMKGGGIAVFAMPELKGRKPQYLGSVFGIVPGPRDIEVSRDGEMLYVSCNASGVIARVPVIGILAALGAEPKKSVQVDRKKLGAQVLVVGLGARSMRISPDQKFLYVAVNQTSDVVAVNLETMNVEARVPVDSYPVGLDLSPDGKKLWVTSQGRSAQGGNSVNGYDVIMGPRPPEPTPSPSTGDRLPAKI